VREWRSAVSNLKNVLKARGVLVLTTRSRGFGYHGYPFDYWRYESTDIEEIFSDLRIEALERDPVAPGIFLKATKPEDFSEKNLASIELYSILRNRRCRSIGGMHILLFKTKWLLRRTLAHILPGPVKRAVKRAVLKES
jgi:hypothetical protein